jgi:two-component system heavy metal sensor histidine kinase CusS
MFLNRTEPRSITARLVLLFTLAAALLLSCSLGVFYWIVVRHAIEEDNAVLADKVQAVSAQLKKEPGTHEQFAQRRDGESAIYLIRVIGPDGGIVSETPGMDRALPANIFPPPVRSTSSFRHPKNYRAGAQLFSLAATTENVNGKAYTIQVAQDRSADERFRKQFTGLLVVVLAFDILASALIAITVTKRGLQPLSHIRRSFERIGPTHFSERVAPTKWPSELRPLAVAFDAMLDRLENSFTRLSQFSADLAHELRTPITNILGTAQVTLTRERTPQEYLEVIESTAAECERLSGIVDNLLFLARAESADKQIQPSDFNGREAVEKIAAYFQPLGEDRHVTIRCEGEAQIFADPTLFGRAVSNLIENALRFSPDGGTIHIEISARDAGTEISVVDNGCGIAAEHLPRIFDRFYRVDSARSSVGTGLGLALVKSIVDLHGGSASVESEPERMTRVTLKFPGSAS